MLDVHIGFMDEEVSELLRCLIKKYGGSRPILAIERGRKSQGEPLFEKPFSTYTTTDVSIHHVDLSVVPEDEEGKHKDISLERRLKNYLEHVLSNEAPEDKEVVSRFIEKRIRRRILTAEDVKLQGNPQLSIIRFNPALDNTSNPIILIRNPEMGKQPSLVRPYERIILKAISQLKEAEEGIRLHSFASGGAIDPKITPGYISRPMASLYIGAEVDEQERVYATVNLIALTTVKTDDPNVDAFIPQHFEFFRKETATTANNGYLSELGSGKGAHEEAIKLAENHILHGDDKLLKSVLSMLKKQYDGIALDKLAVPASRQPEITASFSYFDSLEMKKGIWESLSQTVVDSNMEDYHVLRLAKSMLEKGGRSKKYAPLVDCDILRLNANIFVPDKITKSLETWLDKARLTRDDYVQSIMWGLQGCPLDGMSNLPPGAKNWTFLDELEETDKKYLYQYEGCCLDPFCCEIATNLLGELKAGKGLVGGSENSSVQGIAGEANQKALSVDWNDPARVSDLEAVVRQLVSGLNDWCGFDAGDGKMYCWLRTGKWEPVTTNILKGDAIKELKSNKASVDRMLYKSANLIALQVLASVAADRTDLDQGI